MHLMLGTAAPNAAYHASIDPASVLYGRGIQRKSGGRSGVDDLGASDPRRGTGLIAVRIRMQALRTQSDEAGGQRAFGHRSKNSIAAERHAPCAHIPYALQTRGTAGAWEPVHASGFLIHPGAGPAALAE